MPTALAMQRARESALATEVLGKTRVYLDLKYWIYLRDAWLGRPKAPSHTALLEVLSEKVANGTHVCPLEFTLFSELLKQGSADLRLAAAEVMDRLSGGVTLKPYPDRMRAEVLRFLTRFLEPEEALFRLEELLWTKVGSIAGYFEPELPGVASAENQAIQSLFAERMWQTTLVEMLEVGGDALVEPRLEHARWAEHTNAQNAAHAGELTTLQKTFEAELRGVFEAEEELLREAVAHLFEKQRGRRATPEELFGSDPALSPVTLFANVCLQRNFTRELPTFHILAWLSARTRQDRQRKLRANDLDDFFHAAAALSSCNVFLTERSLAALVTAAPSLADMFGVQVVHQEEDALTRLKD